MELSPRFSHVTQADPNGLCLDEQVTVKKLQGGREHPWQFATEEVDGTG